MLVGRGVCGVVPCCCRESCVLNLDLGRDARSAFCALTVMGMSRVLAVQDGSTVYVGATRVYLNAHDDTQ